VGLIGIGLTSIIDNERGPRVGTSLSIYGLRDGVSAHIIITNEQITNVMRIQIYTRDICFSWELKGSA
jgi:hypothetical protein